MKTINIAKEFSDTPLGRFPDDGPFNGEKFREEFLRPAFASDTDVTVDLDGAEGYGSSFLNEAFGGLVRKGYFTALHLRQHLHITCKDQVNFLYRDLIWKHIENARPE